MINIYHQNKKDFSSNRISKNIINHKLYEKIKIQEKEIVSYKNKYNKIIIKPRFISRFINN